MPRSFPHISRPSHDALRLGLGSAVLGWALGAGLLYFPVWQLLELRIFDLFSVYSAPLKTEMPITIVGVDEASTTELNQRWPYPRDLHARLIEKLNAAGAAVIAFDVQFSEPATDAEDARLAAAISAAGNVVLASKYEYHETASTRVFMRMDPIPRFTEAGASAGLTDMDLAGDTVPRRMALAEDAFWRVALRKLEQVMPDAGITEPGVPEGAMIRYLGPPHTFPFVSYYQVINGDADVQDLLQGAMVLIGRSAGPSSEINTAQADTFPTPFTLTTGLLSSGVEIHATQMENALLANMVEPASRLQNLLLLGAAMTFALPWLIWWHPLRSGVLVLTGSAAAVGAAFLLFGLGACDNGSLSGLFSSDCAASGGVVRHLWLASAGPVAGMLVAFVTAGTGSFLTEQRRAGRIRSAFAMYVSGDVVQQMIAHPEKLRLGGERRDITVLFADLAGFTRLAEKLEPDAVAHVVNIYLNAMTRVIMKNGGTVDKFIGDAVMAFWGAPLDDESHPAHAVAAALEMQDAMEQLQPRFAELGSDRLALRIGLNSGPAIVGNMGSDLRFDYTALGDTVNLASRLEGANKAYGTPILAAESTMLLTRDRFPMRQVDRVRVKGKDQPANIYTPCADTNLVALTDLAWRSYVSRDWSGAREKLALIHEIAPSDSLAAMLGERINTFRREAPPAQWDGSIGLEKLQAPS